MTERKFLYMVRQTQPFENYDKTTIAIYDNLEQAESLARLLNKEYAEQVELDEDYNFISENSSTNEGLHYYDVESIELNEPFEKFGV